MSRDEVLIIEAMRYKGGSFVQKLAEAYVAADADNRLRIRVTWGNYWVAYDAMAKHLLAVSPAFVLRAGANDQAVAALEGGAQ
jgi:hypothetical protein